MTQIQSKKGSTPLSNRPTKRRTVDSLVRAMQDAFVGVQRGIAGYQALISSLGTHQGSPVDRERGLPIFRFSASANGTDSIECVADLKQIHPEHVQMVLAPLIHVQGRQAYASLVELLQNGGELLKVLENSLASQQQDHEDDTEGDGKEPDPEETEE